MTPAETLREAARLMRERAKAATPGPWTSDDEQVWRVDDSFTVIVRSFLDDADSDLPHIASWHPTVALAVAKLVECPCDVHALAVARAYLGSES